MAIEHASWFGRMLKAMSASDSATPEDIEHFVSLRINGDQKRSARDADEEDKKAVKDAEEETKKAEEKAASDKAAKDASDKAAKDAESEDKGETLHPRLAEACDHIASMKDSMDAISEHLGIEKNGEAATGDASVLELSGDEDGKSVLGPGAKDSADFLKIIKPLVAASKDKSVRDAYTARVRGLKGETPAVDSYAAFVALASVNDGVSDDFDVSEFYKGVPFPVGEKRYQEYLAAKKGKK